MNHFEKTSLLTLFLGISPFFSVAYGETFYGAGKTVSLSNVIENTAVPDTWIKLATVSMNTPPGDGYIDITSSIKPCGSYFCTGGTIPVGYSGKASYSIYLTRYPATISDDSGNNYIFSVALPSGTPKIYISEQNTGWGTYIHSDSGLSSYADFSQPSSSQNAMSAAMTSVLNSCGNLYGCTIKGAAWMKGDVSSAIYINLPKNLSAQTLTFNNLKILSLSGYISKQNNLGTVELPTVSLTISGSITIPERCFFNVDSSLFNFDSIFSNAENGLQGTKTANVTTTCNYAPEGTKQYIKMTAISGGKLNNDNNYYEVGNDSAANKSLGLIFKVNGTISDCDSNGDAFDSEYLTSTFSYALNEKKSTPINFYLCKYGIPEKIGEQSIILRLTSRWVIE
ncbi:hypothetical protein [Escherichia coli]|uniref:hypothetical protein n=1 Tax=Escherichia coli TaxID=562 RepID=UPI0010CBC491|nr:hypothetical protein [Escherichia coli]GCX73706.1 hypothetical protein HmCmsJML066_01398 [Escherichia coli]